MFSFFMNFYPVVRSGFTNLLPHQKCRRFFFPPDPIPHLLFVELLIMAMLTGLRWYLRPTVVLIWISLIISNVEHLFMWLLEMCMPSLKKNVYLGLLPILIFCVCFWTDLCVYFRYQILTGHIACKYFLPIRWLSFHLFISFLCCIKAYKLEHVPLGADLRKHCYDLSQRSFCL